jgi:hypothetical protein
MVHGRGPLSRRAALVGWPKLHTVSSSQSSPSPYPHDSRTSAPRAAVAGPSVSGSATSGCLCGSSRPPGGGRSRSSSKMQSLWGSRKKSGGDAGNEDEGAAHEGHTSGHDARTAQEAGERTRLLPPRNDGYLEPDDPAVRNFPGSLSGSLQAKMRDRSLHTTSGAYGPCATLPSSFS